jgi:hypothetical protein
LKLYVVREKDDWSLTDKVTKEIASVRHLEELIRKGERPYSGTITVEEGTFSWSENEKRYIYANVATKTSAAADIPVTTNGVALTLSIIGYITGVAGLILGISLGGDTSTTIGIIISGIVTGALFVGFAEVISLLDKIHRKLDR